LRAGPKICLKPLVRQRMQDRLSQNNSRNSVSEWRCIDLPEYVDDCLCQYRNGGEERGVIGQCESLAKEPPLASSVVVYDLSGKRCPYVRCFEFAIPPRAHLCTRRRILVDSSLSGS